MVTVSPSRPQTECVTPDQYLYRILVREAVDTGPKSPVRALQTLLMPLIHTWAESQENGADLYCQNVAPIHEADQGH